MKIKIAVIVCLLVIVGAWVYAHAQTTQSVLLTGSNGRYQIVAMDFDAGNMNGDMKYKTVVRIDTQTGRTWQLTEIPVQGTGGNTWSWMLLDQGR